MKHSFLFSFVIALTGCGLLDPPDAVKQSFALKYPGAEATWQVDENGYWEAHFNWEDEKLRADFAPEGVWRETEHSISYKKLPDAVKAVIEKDFSKKDVTEMERVDNAEKGVFFDVEFDPKNGEKYDVEFRESGEIIARKRR